MRNPSPPSFSFQPVRTRLLAELSASRDWPKVINLVAPIGYGKTVLMSQLHAELLAEGRSACWVGLDERDVGVDRVLGALLEVLTLPRGNVDPTQAPMLGDHALDRRRAALLDV